MELHNWEHCINRKIIFVSNKLYIVHCHNCKQSVSFTYKHNNWFGTNIYDLRSAHHCSAVQMHWKRSVIFELNFQKNYGYTLRTNGRRGNIAGILQQNSYKKFHHTFNVFLHYLVKCKQLEAGKPMQETHAGLFYYTNCVLRNIHRFELRPDQWLCPCTSLGWNPRPLNRFALAMGITVHTYLTIGPEQTAASATRNLNDIFYSITELSQHLLHEWIHNTSVCNISITKIFSIF